MSQVLWVQGQLRPRSERMRAKRRGSWRRMLWFVSQCEADSDSGSEVMDGVQGQE